MHVETSPRKSRFFQPKSAFVNSKFIIVSLHLVFQTLSETKVFDASLLLVKEGN